MNNPYSHSPYLAGPFEEGKEEFYRWFNGFTTHPAECPYSEGSEEARVWQEGFNEAEFDLTSDRD